MMLTNALNQSYGDAKECSPDPRGPILRALDDLDSERGAVERAMSELEAKLLPVTDTRPEPQSIGGAVAPRPGPACDVHGRLLTASEELDSLRSRIQRLTHRIAL